MIYAVLILFGLFLLTFILFICQRGKTKDYKTKYEQKTEAYNGLQEEFNLYRQAEQFKHQKEEETNEKIDDLHSGKLSADDILPKR